MHYSFSYLLSLWGESQGTQYNCMLFYANVLPHLAGWDTINYIVPFSKQWNSLKLELNPQIQLSVKPVHKIITYNNFIRDIHEIFSNGCKIFAIILLECLRFHVCSVTTNKPDINVLEIQPKLCQIFIAKKLCMLVNHFTKKSNCFLDIFLTAILILANK